MKIGIHGNADKETIDTCKRLGIDWVCLMLPYGERGYVELGTVKEVSS